MVGWTEVGPCRLSTVVPVEVHARLVNPGKDTCDLDGGVEFFVWFVMTVDSVEASFIFTLCRCVVLESVHVVLAVFW